MRTTRSWMIYGVILVGPSCSFEPPPAAIQRCCWPQRLARLDSENKENAAAHQLHELLRQGGLDPQQCQLEPLSGPGFCNVLYKVQCGKNKMGGKIFSSIAKARMRSNGNRIDWMASQHDLGPKVYASSRDGILMQWLDGAGLNETIVHSSSDWIDSVASRLASFHSLEVPPRPPHMLWETLQIMMHMTHGDDSVVIRDHVCRQQELLETLNLPVVVGHGDFKPSNIVGDRFIDFETSGMNYRAFDIAKLFRTDYPTQLTDDNMNVFLECYLLVSSECLVDHSKEIELFKLETKLLEPLTWLEAAVFFVCLATVDQESAEKWNRLAAERLESYERSTAELASYVAEYRRARQ